ncbi:retrotransposon ORF1 [Tanacetum coccineum]
MVRSRDESLITQNSGVSTPGENGSMFYGLLEEIMELNYLTHQKVVLFRCKWFKTNNTRSTSLCVTKNNITSISTRDEWWKENQYILATQARQDKDVIVDADVVHDCNSSDVALIANLEDLEYSRLSGAGPSTEVSFIPTSRVNDDDFIDDDVEYDVDHTMAMVVREDGPPDDDTWEPRPIKKNAKGRKKGSDAALIRKFELGEKKRLSIKFDLHELRTAKPIGPNRRHFTGLIGNEIERSVPFCYESWDLVPDKHKGTIWPAINVTYFDMKEHLSGPNAKQVEKGMELQFKGQYRNRKNKFKDEMFVSRGGYENPVKMRNFPPPGKSLSEWHELCDHFTSEKHLAHSAKNKANRAKLPQCSTQGSKSYAASRHEEWETNGVFPDLIELYKKTHQKEGKWAKDVFEARYICSGPHDTQYCMKDPEQAFVEYASSHINETGVSSARSHPTMDPQCSTQIHSSINTITIHPKQQNNSCNDKTEENEEEERDRPENHPNSPTPPDPSISFITEKFLKLNSLFESLGLVPPSPNAELVCTKEEDGDVMFIEIILKDDNSHMEETEPGVQEVDSIIDPRLSHVVLRRPFVEMFDMTHDLPEGVVRFINGTDGVAYKMPHKIEQYDSLSDLEKEHTKSVYLRNKEDKRRGVEYVMSKILGFYKECLKLGPKYLTGMDDEGEVM